MRLIINLVAHLLHFLDCFRGTVTSVVLTLDFNHHPLHLFRLSFPLRLAHLLLSPEQLFVRLPVAATKTVPQGCELAVVVVEVQVVHCVACCAIDNGRVGHIFAIVNHDSPDLNEGEERDIGELLEWEQEWEQVVWHALTVTIERVECMRGVWCWHDPFVVRLVESLVDQRMVETSMDPVDAEVGEHEEERELDVVVRISKPTKEWMFKARVRRTVVDEGVASDFSDEEGYCEDGHDRNRLHGLSNFHAHLIL